jgi:hypothetical protein
VASTRGADGESTEIRGVHVSNANLEHLAALGELVEKGDPVAASEQDAERDPVRAPEFRLRLPAGGRP